MKRILVLSLLILIAGTSYASSEDVIKGFSKYQAGRVENIILNEMLSEVRSNRYFIQIFPMTNDAVDNYGNESGKRLIPLMQHFVEKDIDAFEEFSRCMVWTFYKKIENENDLNQISSKGKSLYIDLQTKFNKSSYTISDALVDKELCDQEQLGSAVVLTEIQDEKVYKKLKQLVDKLKLEVVGSSDSKLVRKYRYWRNIYEYTKYLSSQESSIYIKMHHLVLSFDKLGLSDGDVFLDFRELSLFLAQLSDAAKANDGGASVEAVISNFVETENDSFNIKRTGLGLASRYCNNYLCKPAIGIGSYFGVGDTFSGEDRYRVYGPLGVEIRAFNYFGHMAFIGFSPLDFGIPIRNELTEKEYSASFEDIRSNSVYISYSYKHKPLSVIASYHPDDSNTTGENDSLFMLSIAFDLPIYFF